MKTEIPIDINDIFLEQRDINADVTVNIGGRWSGKTYSVNQCSILDSMEKPGLKTAKFRKTYASIKESLYADLLGTIQDFGMSKGEHYDSRLSPLHINIGPSQYLFRGIDDPHKVKGLADCHEAHLEEASEFSEEDFDTILLSLRGKSYPMRLHLTTNPVPTLPGSPHWLQKRFNLDGLPLNKNVVYQDKQLGKICVCKSNYQANKFCPPHVKKLLEEYKHSNPSLYEMWVLGNFAMVEGVILKNWTITKEQPDDRLFIGYGLDFGFSNDPAALTKLWLDDKLRKLYIKPLLYSVDLTNDALADIMRGLGVDSYDTIIADSAEPKSIKELFNFGFRRIDGAKKRPNYKTEMAKVLQGYEILILDSQYNNEIRSEFSTWSWMKDNNGNQLPKPTDGNDHFIDSVVMRLHNLLDSPMKNGMSAPEIRRVGF
jgi:phage terminase large subunit